MIRFLTILFFVLLFATLGMLFMTKGNFGVNIAEKGEQGTGIAQIGGDFLLVNQDGKTVSSADFRGRVSLVFFGFTHCPDICPVTTATMAKILASLGDKADGVAPIFITVDPKNDTPEVLKSYLANFDPRIIGLTGTDAQISAAADAYKAYFSANGDAVDHSGFIYLMDKNGVYFQHFAYDESAETIVDAVRKLLE